MIIIPPPVILGFYGSSNTGKTTIVTHLISWLTTQNYQVASIKKTPQSLTLDKPGKDSYHHATAGAQPVVFSTADETSFIFQQPLSEPSIIQKIQSLCSPDVILIEGITDQSIPKIRMDQTKPLRPNTILTYDQQIEPIKQFIITEIERRKEKK